MKKIIFILAGLGFTLIFFWNNLTMPAVNINPNVGTNDLTDLNYPFRNFLIQSLKVGEFPLWSKDISGGFPILAEGQIAGLFPIYLILAKLPLMESVNYTLSITYFFIFLFAFLYLSEIGLKEESSFFASLLIAFGGFSVSELFHWTMLNAFYLFLAQLYFLHLYFRKKQFVYILLMAIMLGLSFLGGHPQIIFYSMLFILPYWAYFRFKEDRGEMKKKELIKSLLKFIISVSVFLIIALGIGAGQLLPEIEFTLNSTRAAGLSAQSAQRFSFNLKDIVSILIPRYPYMKNATQEAFINNGWPIDEKYFYFGIIGLITLIFGVMRHFRELKENKYLRIFSLYFLFFLIFSFGGKIVLGKLFLLPPFSFFRLPFRMMFLANLAIGVFAGFFINSFFEKKIERRRKIYTYLLLIFAVLILFFDLRNASEKLHPPVDAGMWYQLPQTYMFLKKNLKGEERVSDQAYYYPSLKLYLTNYELWQNHDVISNLRNLLPVFNNLLYDVPKNVGAANSAGLKIPWFNDLEQEIYFNGINYSNSKALTVTDSFLFLNRLMGVRYFISAMPIKNELMSEVYRTNFATGQDEVIVYEIFDYYPRVFMVPTSSRLGHSEIREKLLKGDFNPKNEVLLEEDADWGSKGGFASSAEIKEYKDSRVVVRTQSSGDGFLVLSDTYFPGWKAYLDGNEEKIFRANYAFRAVKVPQGEHEIVFSYDPASFYWGIRISIVSFSVSLVLIAVFFGLGTLKKSGLKKKLKERKK